jgi:hypothetical protein
MPPFLLIMRIILTLQSRHITCAADQADRDKGDGLRKRVVSLAAMGKGEIWVRFNQQDQITLRRRSHNANDAMRV